MISREDFEKLAPKSTRHEIPQAPPPPPPSLKISAMPNRGRGRKHEVCSRLTSIKTLVFKANFNKLYRSHASIPSLKQSLRIWMSVLRENAKHVTAIILLLRVILGGWWIQKSTGCGLLVLVAIWVLVPPKRWVAVSVAVLAVLLLPCRRSSTHLTLCSKKMVLHSTFTLDIVLVVLRVCLKSFFTSSFELI